MKYYVWFKICEEVEAESEDEAFDIAMEHIGERGGDSDIVTHTILEEVK